MIWLIAFVSSITGFLFGFDEGIISGVLATIQEDFQLDSYKTGFMMGLLPFGALAAACVTGRLSDWIGRRYVLYLVAIIFAAATIGIVITNSFAVLCIMRLGLGISIGMSVVVTPLYIAETAPSTIRGKLVACFQLAITVGILASYLTNWFIVGEFPWRWVFALGLIPSIILFIGLFFLPESPRWLYTHGKKREACDILLKVSKTQESYEEIEEDLSLMEDIEIKEKKTNAFQELFSKKFSPTLVLGIGLFFFQQVSGINAVIYYAPTIFNRMRIGSDATELLATVGLGTINVLMTLVAMRWVEKMGRRHLLILGFVGVIVSLGVIAFTTYFAGDSLQWISAIALFLFIAAFAVSIGPLPYILASEVFPMKARGLGMSMSAISNWGFSTLVVASFPILLKEFGISSVFLMYAIASILGLLYAIRYTPETRGISLENIEEHLLAGKPLRKLGR
jgi:sugar porter (SP) family MFS transporter